MTARKTRSTRTQKKAGTGSGLLSPPSSTGDKAGDRDIVGPRSGMISPLPEEDEDRRSKVRCASFTLRVYLISASLLLLVIRYARAYTVFCAVY